MADPAVPMVDSAVRVSRQLVRKNIMLQKNKRLIKALKYFCLFIALSLIPVKLSIPLAKVDQ
jgi:hypothetical protein